MYKPTGLSVMIFESKLHISGMNINLTQKLITIHKQSSAKWESRKTDINSNRPVIINNDKASATFKLNDIATACKKMWHPKK